MPFTFNSATLEAQRDQVTVATFEGDNEIAIIACDMGRYALVVCVQEEGEDVCLLEEFYDGITEALEAQRVFITDEYAGM